MESKQVCEDTYETYVLEGANVLLYTDSNSELYSLDCSKKSIDLPEKLLDKVDYIMLKDAKSQTYRYDADQVSDGDSYVYTVDGMAYFRTYNKNMQNLNLGQAESLDFSYAIDLKSVYKNDGKKLYYCNDISKENYSELCQVSDSVNFVFDPEGKAAYVIKDKSLIQAIRTKIKTLDEKIVDNSLTRVIGLDREKNYGISYIVDGKRYYRKGSAAPVCIGDVESSSRDYDVIYAYNRLFYYNSDNKLASCKSSGTDLKLIGQVDKYGLGGF